MDRTRLRAGLMRAPADAALLAELQDPRTSAPRRDEMLRGLVARYQGGDGHALGPLTIAFWRTLNGAARSIGGPDAWGDALEALTDAIDRLNLGACQSVAGAVTTRLRFAGIDRARARAVVTEGLGELAEGMALGVDLSELLGDDEDADQVGRGLGLAEADRRLLVAVHVEGRSMAEVADELGITRTAAKVRHHRLLARLRKSVQ